MFVQFYGWRLHLLVICFFTFHKLLFEMSSDLVNRSHVIVVMWKYYAWIVKAGRL